MTKVITNKNVAALNAVATSFVNVYDHLIFNNKQYTYLDDLTDEVAVTCLNDDSCDSSYANELRELGSVMPPQVAWNELILRITRVIELGFECPDKAKMAKGLRMIIISIAVEHRELVDDFNTYLTNLFDVATNTQTTDERFIEVAIKNLTYFFESIK